MSWQRNYNIFCLNGKFLLRVFWSGKRVWVWWWSFAFQRKFSVVSQVWKYTSRRSLILHYCKIVFYAAFTVWKCPEITIPLSIMLNNFAMFCKKLYLRCLDFKCSNLNGIRYGSKGHRNYLYFVSKKSWSAKMSSIPPT